VETIREVEEDITVDSTFIRFSCEAVEDSLSMLLAEDCDVAVWAVGRLDVDMELPALTISWGTAAAIATAPWNTNPACLVVFIIDAVSDSELRLE
jgi:hypothetical protein